jgi:hypothetical protein
MWCIPRVDGEYVARMESVLDLYAEKPDPKHPVVCFDESPTQLIGEVRQPLSLESFGRRRRTKVLEERTRGVQVSVYGDLVSWLMQGAAE